MVEAHNEPLPIPQVSLPGAGENLFLIVLLFLTSSAFSAFLQGDEATSYGARSGALLTNIIWASMYVVTAIFVMQHCRNARLSFQRSWIFCARRSRDCVASMVRRSRANVLAMRRAGWDDIAVLLSGSAVQLQTAFEGLGMGRRHFHGSLLHVRTLSS